MDFTTGVLIGALIWAVAVFVVVVMWHLQANERERRAKLSALERDGASPYSRDLERRRRRAETAMTRYGSGYRDRVTGEVERHE
jgi:hypothetical protein